VGLAELKDTPIADLPYGTQKRVELARAQFFRRGSAVGGLSARPPEDESSNLDL